MRYFFSLLIVVLIGCKSKPKIDNPDPFVSSDQAAPNKLTHFLYGTWQFETDPEHTIVITKDSLLDYYKNEINSRSFMVIDSISEADKYIIADTAYDFTNAKDSWGLKVKLFESSNFDSSDFLLIYIDKESLEIGDHNGSHIFKRIM